MHNRSSWQIMQDVIWALFNRELKTRFGHNHLGYVWALAMPMLQALMIVIIFSLIDRASIAGVSVAMFMLVAILPFKLFSKLVPQLTAAIDANKALLGYRQVTAFDPIIARVMVESITFALVYILLMLIMAWAGYPVIPENFLQLLAVMVLVLLMAIGIGLILCSAMSYWKDVSKLTSLIMQPLFFISGIMFCATMIPSQYWYLLSWNPLFHMTELSREAFFLSYQSPVGDINYLAQCSLVSFTFGLMIFQINRHRFIGA